MVTAKNSGWSSFLIPAPRRLSPRGERHAASGARNSPNCCNALAIVTVSSLESLTGSRRGSNFTKSRNFLAVLSPTRWKLLYINFCKELCLDSLSNRRRASTSIPYGCGSVSSGRLGRSVVILLKCINRPSGSTYVRLAYGVTKAVCRTYSSIFGEARK